MRLADTAGRFFSCKETAAAGKEQFLCWIMAFDEGVKIVGPERVLERMKEKIKVLNNLYKN